jgi:hypothetical protein
LQFNLPIERRHLRVGGAVGGVSLRFSRSVGCIRAGGGA